MKSYSGCTVRTGSAEELCRSGSGLRGHHGCGFRRSRSSLRRNEIAPRASVLPFIDAMQGQDVRVLEYPGEIGIGLQHLGILVGRRAYARVWPKIVSWLRGRS